MCFPFIWVYLTETWTMISYVYAASMFLYLGSALAQNEKYHISHTQSIFSVHSVISQVPWLLTELCLHNHLSFSHQADNLWKKKMELFSLLSCLRYSTARCHLSGCEIIITSCLIQGEKRLLKTWTCCKNGVFLCLLTTVQVSMREVLTARSQTVLHQGCPRCKRQVFS